MLSAGLRLGGAILADKLGKLITDALRRAATERAGLPLMEARREPGLFPATAAGRSAAERAGSEGLFDRVEGELWSITDAGLTRLLEENSPQQVLEDCVRAIETRQDQLERIRATVSRTHASLDGLRTTVERALRLSGHDDLRDSILRALFRWNAASGQDCPLPDLYRTVQRSNDSPTIGEFHDVLRALRVEQSIDLHPWTGPLYEMPEPAYALMCGHEIVYYARGRATTTAPPELHLAQTS